MPETPLTYAQLDDALRRLGFSVRVVEGKSRIYRHAPTGALIPFPDRPAETSVLPHHLAAVRGVLREYGFGELETCQNGSAARGDRA